jgi:predicted ATPase
MLKRLYVDNYRCLVNFHIELQELTLLVGPNGSRWSRASGCIGAV